MSDNYWTSLASHRVTRRSALQGAAVGVAGLSGAALIGCGGGEKKDDSKPAASTTGAAPGSVADAKKLLDAAGVKDGLNVTILVRKDAYEDLCLFTGDQLAKFGMKAKQDIVETATAYDRMAKRDFDLTPWGHGVSLDDPDALWAEFYIKGAPRNYSELSTPEIEAAYLKQSTELDPAKRKELVKDLQKVSLPALGKSVYYWSMAQAIYYKSVQNWSQHVGTQNYNNNKFQDIWLNA